MSRGVSRHVAEGKNRARKEIVQPDMLNPPDAARDAIHHRLQLFPTPPFATRAVMACLVAKGLIPDRPLSILDPCAGLNHMVTPLRQMGHDVAAYDIHDYGFGHRVADFMSAESHYGLYDLVTINPPFGDPDATSNREPTLAERFVRRAQELAPLVLCLSRISFIATQGRYPLHYANPAGNLRAFMPCTDRPAMFLGRYSPSDSTATDYAWYLYERGYAGRAEVVPVPVGARNFIRQDDVDIHRGWGS